MRLFTVIYTVTKRGLGEIRSKSVEFGINVCIKKRTKKLLKKNVYFINQCDVFL